MANIYSQLNLTVILGCILTLTGMHPSAGADIKHVTEDNEEFNVVF